MKLPESFLRGSYPPLVTPFKNGEVDLGQYRILIERQIREGSHGIVVCGTTGEPSSLTLEERRDLLAVAVETVQKKIPVVAATGSQSLHETVWLCREAQRLGADALLVVTPYYIKPSQTGLREYFCSLGKEIEIPWMIYHIPGRAAVSIQASELEKIARRVPTLVGVKHAANDLDFVSEVLQRLGKEFRVFCGLESLSLPMLAVGAAGLMNAVANLTPKPVAQLCEAMQAGRWEEARVLHFQLFELNRAIFLNTNPIPLKYMMARLGLLPSGAVRLPLAEPDEREKEELDLVLRRAGLLSHTVSQD